MSSDKITLIGFYNWFAEQDVDMWSTLTLPAGIDKDTLTNNILLRGGEFEVIYSDPDFMRRSFVTWSHKWSKTFEKWVKALSIEYSPLENYDRFEDWSDNGSGQNSNTQKVNTTTKDINVANNNSTETFNNDDTETLNTLTTNAANGHDVINSNTENTVSAFDESSYSPHDKSETTSDTTTTTNSTSADTGNIKNEHRGTIKNDVNSGFTNDGTLKTDIENVGNNTNNSTHVGRIHGNIGVTTSQQMLESELEIAYWNMYDHITDVFLREYVIPVY